MAVVTTAQQNLILNRQILNKWKFVLGNYAFNTANHSYYPLLLCLLAEISDGTRSLSPPPKSDTRFIHVIPDFLAFPGLLLSKLVAWEIIGFLQNSFCRSIQNVCTHTCRRYFWSTTDVACFLKQ